MGETCNLCSFGFYKNNSGSHAALFDNCTECSSGWTTLRMGSTSSDNCSVRKYFLLVLFEDERGQKNMIYYMTVCTVLVNN